MPYDPVRHHRRSIRLKDYDYALAGAYTVTVCAQNRACLFGEIVDGAMRLGQAGAMVQTTWEEIPTYYPGVQVDAFVVMPNHVHGIVVLSPPDDPTAAASVSPTDGAIAALSSVGAGPRACPDRPANAQIGFDAATPPADHEPLRTPRSANEGGQARGPAPTVPAPMSLSEVVHRFKSLTTARYRHGVAAHDWPPFAGRLWQRNFYEHIIRNEATLERHRQYIADNPARWYDDPENPALPPSR